jgi:Protein of unknown function (DUF3108)
LIVAKRSRLNQGLVAALPMLLLAASGVDAAAVEPDRIKARFEVYGFAGLHVLTNRTTVERFGDRYRIATDLDTRGLARVFVDLTSHSEVSGRLGTEGARPEIYRADVRRNGAERHYAVDFRHDGAIINASAPPSPGQATPNWTKEIEGAVDQLTTYFLVEKQLTVRGTCSLVVPVFDGSALYNLRSIDVARQTLSADDHQNFAGSSQVCEVRREDLSAAPNQDESTYQRGKIWYTRLIAGEMTPVRMEFTTAFGVVKAYLAQLWGRGVDLHFTRE